MNTQQHKDYRLVVKILGLILLMAACNAKAADIPPKNIECLFNWAQTFYPGFFSPLVPNVQVSSPYTYRYYSSTNAYLAVSSADNHVYYLGPTGALQDEGEVSAWLAMSGCGARPYPVIFVHGLASSADTWATYRNYLIGSGLWTFGGIPAYNPATKTINIGCPADTTIPCTGGAGDFYTLNFSNNQNLTLSAQGSELAGVIKTVLAANPASTKVILVSHSMGGLAARAYLQGLAQDLNSAMPLSYRADVAKLIAIAAPHQGAFWAEACQNSFSLLNVSVDSSICNLLPVQIDTNSTALEDLKPKSTALNTLNDLAAHPLPADISYVSIIGTGQQTLDGLVDFTDGDGVVTDSSQDLAMVAGTLLQQKSVRLNIPLRDCGNKISLPSIDNLSETHTCETTDVGVGLEMLRDLQ
ncbi:MAG: esterase/lipase family protein [Methylobacter sp.]